MPAPRRGLWKIDDAGLNWYPVLDDHPVHAIGEVGVSRSDRDIVWVGSGELFLRSNLSFGNGVSKSTDAGRDEDAHGAGGDGSHQPGHQWARYT